MIKHIVFFRIKADNKEEKLHFLKRNIEYLNAAIPSLTKIKAGINFSNRETAYDLALVAEFTDDEGLEVYRTHPAHQELIGILKEFDRELAVVDYYF